MENWIRVLEKIAFESGEGIAALTPANAPYSRQPTSSSSTSSVWGEPAFDLVHIAFEHHAQSHPDNIAVEDFAHTITYEEVDRPANCLAATLRFRGAKPVSRVSS